MPVQDILITEGEDGLIQIVPTQGGGSSPSIPTTQQYVQYIKLDEFQGGTFIKVQTDVNTRTIQKIEFTIKNWHPTDNRSIIVYCGIGPSELRDINVHHGAIDLSKDQRVATTDFYEHECVIESGDFKNFSILARPSTTSFGAHYEQYFDEHSVTYGVDDAIYVYVIPSRDNETEDYELFPYISISLWRDIMTPDEKEHYLKEGTGGYNSIAINKWSLNGNVRFFWDKQSRGVYQSVIETPNRDIKPDTNRFSGPEYGFLWMGELYREDTNEDRNYSDNDYEREKVDTKWFIGGEEELLSQDGNPINLKWDIGDTYYMRYDHLKTYSTLEQENGITDIVSFMCETRVNLDGRYDNNRGNPTNFIYTVDNFQKLNKNYNNDSGYFTYRSTDNDSINVQYGNTVLWSTSKTFREKIDSWTNITLQSALELDGSSGKISSIQNSNDKLIALQNTGINVINFNSRVQISTSDNVPIEISNSGKVDGFINISKTVGCQSIDSVVQGEQGLYFVDDYNSSIYRIGTNGLENLTDKLGMATWMKTEYDKGFKVYYDKYYRDVYFVNETQCLCFSENLNQFSGFFNYENVDYMFNIEDSFMSIKNDSIYSMFSGEYNYFFDEYKPYWVTYRVSPDPYIDKIFDHIEFRQDTYGDLPVITNVGTTPTVNYVEHNMYKPDKAFNYLIVNNEYQESESALNSNNTITQSNNVKTAWRASSLKKKFRIWRANIPRVGRQYGKIKDRIRNPWIYITLKQTMGTSNDELDANDALYNNNNKTVLYDTLVHYYDSTTNVQQ